ncbi:MAG: HEPN family nuclease [Crocinitomicaceae bacterium]
MGNYGNIERDFVDRTLRLIHQYTAEVGRYEFPEQLNYTLLINCLLGLIVFPVEKVSKYIPNDRILSGLKEKHGFNSLTVGPNISTVRDLVTQLRNAVAHFSFKVISESEENLIDKIEFYHSAKYGGLLICEIRAGELLNFVSYYGYTLLSAIDLQQDANE